MGHVAYGKWLEEGFTLFWRNAWILISTGFVAILLSAATAGILAGPMSAGMILITLSLHDRPQQKPEAGLLFRGFNYFLDSLLFFLVWGTATGLLCVSVSRFPCVGPLAALFVVYLAQALLMFGMFLIVDKGLTFKEASLLSYRSVAPDFWHFLSFAAIASIIGSAGAALCGIGVIVTLPIQICLLTVAYRDVFGTDGGLLQG